MKLNLQRNKVWALPQVSVPFCPAKFARPPQTFKKKSNQGFQQTWRLRGCAWHSPRGWSLAAARLEGAVYHLDSALKARGGEILAVKRPASPLSEGVSMHAHACKMVAVATVSSSESFFFNACMRMPCRFDS